MYIVASYVAIIYVIYTDANISIDYYVVMIIQWSAIIY